MVYFVRQFYGFPAQVIDLLDISLGVRFFYEQKKKKKKIISDMKEKSCLNYMKCSSLEPLADTYIIIYFEFIGNGSWNVKCS